MKILRKTLNLTKKFLKFLSFLLIFNCSIYAKSSNLQVIDGDTIKFNEKKFRLYGIDAPEINQKCKINGKDYFCGRKSKDFLEAKILEANFWKKFDFRRGGVKRSSAIMGQNRGPKNFFRADARKRLKIPLKIFFALTRDKNPIKKGGQKIFFALTRD